MSDTLENLRRKLRSAQDLKSVVRTMKALAASSLVQYERAVQSLGHYQRTVELGISVCLRHDQAQPRNRPPPVSPVSRVTGAIVFGSDQGLVGRFNEAVTELAIRTLLNSSSAPLVWVVGERAQLQLVDAGVMPVGAHKVPNSCEGITPLVSDLLLGGAEAYFRGAISELILFYNQPARATVYEPISLRILPLEEGFKHRLLACPWETKSIAEVLGEVLPTLNSLIGEYLFVVLYRASAESLASENTSRLVAMQRAEKNIDEMLESLRSTFHQLRQSGIDAELFDVVSGFEALGSSHTQR